MSTVHKPTAEVIIACDLIDEGIGQFVKMMRDQSIGKYEFQVDCLINITHAHRILEGILELARKDLVHIQSGLILARTIFEILIKVCWVLHPTDNFEIESRYVSLLNTESAFLERWIKELTNLKSPDLEKEKKNYKGLLSFKDKLSALLEKKGYSIKPLPDVRKILKSVGEERKYLYYMLLSQYTHLTHYSGNIYRQNLGNKKILSEEPKMNDWKMLLVMSWTIFETTSELFIFTITGQKNFYNPELKELIRNSCLEIK